MKKKSTKKLKETWTVTILNNQTNEKIVCNVPAEHFYYHMHNDLERHEMTGSYVPQFASRGHWLEVKCYVPNPKYNKEIDDIYGSQND